MLLVIYKEMTEIIVSLLADMVNSLNDYEKLSIWTILVYAGMRQFRKLLHLNIKLDLCPFTVLIRTHSKSFIQYTFSIYYSHTSFGLQY